LIKDKGLNKGTILIVDDIETNLRILKELIGDKYNVILSMDSTKVMDLTFQYNPDLIILDIMMPECNGYEVCQKLKQNPKTKDIPVIFITVRTDEDSLEKAYNAGGIDFISKPFKPKELMMRISTQLKLKKLIEDLKSSKKQLKNLASTDSLTSLYNRRYCIDMSNQMIKKSIADNLKLSVMMLDLDNFKTINDKYGHMGGDKVLIDVGNIIRELIGKPGIVCRYGGEEFVVVLPNTDIEESIDIAKKLNKAIKKLKIKFENHIIRLTVSIGISSVNMDSEDTIDKALTRADKALYRVKNSGKDGFDVEF